METPPEPNEHGPQEEKDPDTARKTERARRRNLILAWLTAASAILLAATTLLGRADSFVKAYRSFLRTGCTAVDVDVKSFSSVPYSLSPTISYRRALGEADLYWLMIEAHNRCWRQDVDIKISFEIVQGRRFAKLCHDTDSMSVKHREARTAVIDPEFYFYNPDKPSILKVSWTVFPADQEDAEPIHRDAEELAVLPRGIFAWDWRDPNEEPVDKEFLLASLAVWAFDEQRTVEEVSKRLTTSTDARVNPEDPAAWTLEWMGSAYRELFENPSRALTVFAGDSLLRMREIKMPEEILEASEGGTGGSSRVDFVEAALLLAALSHRPFKSYSLSLISISKQHHFLVWSAVAGQWRAVDLRRTSQSFEENLEAATRQVAELLQEMPAIEGELSDEGEGDGVHFDAERQIAALNFRKAAEHHRIVTRADPPSCEGAQAEEGGVLGTF